MKIRLGDKVIKFLISKPLLKAAMLALMVPTFVAAQTASGNTETGQEVAIASKAVSDPVFANQLSNELARCHGFLYALQDNLTQDINMSLDTIQIIANVSQAAQTFGYASVLVNAYHSENMEAAHLYANSISREARIVWGLKLEAAKTDIMVVSLPEVQECYKHLPVATWLYDGAVATKSNTQFE